eukprot:4491089-Pleurochrysis_carterae.AAC.1
MGSSAGAGAGAHLGGGSGRGRSEVRGHRERLSKNLERPAERERSTSAPQVCMRCNAKTVNCSCVRQTARERCAHEDRTANDWRARR